MASITIRLLEQTTGCAVRIRISHNHTSSFVNTGIIVRKEDFSERNLYAPILPSDKRYIEKNKHISEFVVKFNDAIFDLSNTIGMHNVTANDIRDAMIGKKVVSSNHTLISRFEEYGGNRDCEKSKMRYNYAMRKIVDYIGEDARSFLMSDVTYAFVVDLERHLKQQGLKTNSIAGIMRNLKAVYNDSVNRGIIDDKNRTFKLYKIKPKKVGDIEYLTTDQVARILSMDFSRMRSRTRLERARDIFAIGLCLCGANLADIYEMQPANGDEIVFVRKKIARTEPPKVRIFIENELRTLIYKYKGVSHLFNFSEKSNDYATFQRNVNRGFEALSEIAGFKVNMAICRHTWASLCHRIGIDLYIISKGLGHVEGDITSQHYSNFDWSTVRRANRKLLDSIYSRVKDGAIVCIGSNENYAIQDNY